MNERLPSPGVSTEETETGPSSEFAPLHKNRTYIDYGDHEFQEWLRGKDPGTRTHLLEKYKKLERYNRGTHKMSNKTDRTIMRRMNDWYLCHAIATQLELDNWEKKAVWHMLDPLDLRAFKKYDRNDGGPTRKASLVAFCSAILLHNDCQTDNRSAYYPGKSIDQPPKWDGLFQAVEDLRDRPGLFEQLQADIGFEEATVISCLEKMRSEMNRRYSKKKQGTLSISVVEDSDCWTEYINPHGGIQETVY